MEKSLVLIKPDAVQRNLIGAIIALYEKEGLVVEKLLKLSPSKSQAAAHYQDHQEKSFYPGLIESLTSSDIVAMVLQGDGAIEKVRAINGATDPKKANPGTIRALYGQELPNNSVHASDSPESAAREASIWFPKN